MMPSTEPLKVVVIGAAGNMGRNNIKAIKETPGIKLVGAIETPSHPLIYQDAGIVAGVGSLGVQINNRSSEVITQGDVIIDFSSTEATMQTLELNMALQKPIPMVIGTTALTEEIMDKIRQLSLHTSIVQDVNMSVGMNLLFTLLPKLVSILGADYDNEIVEAHHRMKKDAPSGTAIRLGEILARVKKTPLEDIVTYGRHGNDLTRDPNEIGIHAVRGGGIVGEHTILFAALEEQVEITHKALSKMAFARGGVRAAFFTAKMQAGLYNMRHVLTPMQ